MLRQRKQVGLEDLREMVEYWANIPEEDFTRQLADLMVEKGMSNADLARAAGVRRSYVTKVMAGDLNATIKSLTKFAMALGMVPRITLAPQELGAKPLSRRSEVEGGSVQRHRLEFGVPSDDGASSVAKLVDANRRLREKESAHPEVSWAVDE